MKNLEKRIRELVERDLGRIPSDEEIFMAINGSGYMSLIERLEKENAHAKTLQDRKTLLQTYKKNAA